MVFALNGVHVVSDKSGNVTDLRFGMNEILLGRTVNIDVSIGDINELMEPVILKIDPKYIH